MFSLLYIFLACLLSSPLCADKNPFPVNENEPVLYYADAQTYDRELELLILEGNVEFHHEGTVLTADRVTYRTYKDGVDIITASGNVHIRSPDGDEHFAEYVELTGDFKEGVSLQLRTLLADDSKLAALEGRKCGANEELDKVVYTPCELCGDKKPTWQLNARHAVRDGTKNDIDFTDAQLRMWDIPLLYLPYVTQPLERRSGVLLPLPRYSSDLGFMAQVPYFIAISQDKDLTLTPTYISKQNPLLLSTYRQALNNGFFEMEGSVTKYNRSAQDTAAQRAGQYKVPTTRGHAYANGQWNLSDVWRLKTEGGYVSDKTYFRRYVFSGWQADPNLASKGLLEGFLTSRDYSSAKIDYYQGLRAEDQQKYIPVVLPMFTYSGYPDVGAGGGRFRMDGNLLNLYRSSGSKMQRGVGLAEWRRPWVAPSGQLLTLFSSVRGDLYEIEKYPFSTSQRKGVGRFFPQGGLEWNWPFMQSWEKQGLVVQPLAQIRGAPAKAIGVSANQVPNEDSLDFLFNELNLFSTNRFPGYDLVDTGSRAVYGGQALLTGAPLGEIDFFFGQNYAYAQEDFLSKIQGVKKGASDYVGHVEAYPVDWVSLHYRFRLYQKTVRPKVSEVGGSVGPAIAKLSGTYVYLDGNNRWMGEPAFEQMALSFSSAFTKCFSLEATLLQNLRSNTQYGGTLIKGISLTYRDDCFVASIGVQRQYFVANDVRPSTLFLFTIGFKNVGEYTWSRQLNSYSPNPDKGLGLFEQYSGARTPHVPY